MPCAHVIFDTEPTPRGKTSPATLQQMALGMIRYVWFLILYYYIQEGYKMFTRLIQ